MIRSYCSISMSINNIQNLGIVLSNSKYKSKYRKVGVPYFGGTPTFVYFNLYCYTAQHTTFIHFITLHVFVPSSNLLQKYETVVVLPIRIVKSNVSSVGPSSERSTCTPTFSYFDLYPYTAYAAHYIRDFKHKILLLQYVYFLQNIIIE